MKLYINVTQLSKFEDLFIEEEFIKSAVERDTGIRWAVNASADIEEIERILVKNKIKHQWDGK